MSWVVIVALACSGCLPELGAAERKLRDLEYARAGETRLKLDLYLPAEAKGPLPLVVWIHGGSYRAGSKNVHSPAQPMVGMGYAVASIDYRLSQIAKFPAQIHDCKAAIRWLRANASRHGLDSNRFGVWGSSAGGHLAALVGTTGPGHDLEGDLGQTGVSSEVQAVCDWFGPTDFLAIRTSGKFRHENALSVVAELLGGPLESKRELAATATPLRYASAKTPPFLIMHGDQDQTVPFQQSALLADGLKKLGVEVTLISVPGAGHGFGSPEVFQTCVRFFDTHLKHK